MPERGATLGQGSSTEPLLIGIAGLGNIGSAVAHWITASAPTGIRLTAATGRDLAATAAKLLSLGLNARAISLPQLIDHCDVLVDCLDPSASAAMLDACIDSGKTIVPLSVCVLLQNPDLVERARRAGTRILVPSGAVAGIDALRAASIGNVKSVKVRTSKPPSGLDDVSISSPRCLFSGNALDACNTWPRNVNIAATLSLAGIGGERTEVEIWSDPSLEHNVHEIEIDSDSTRVRIRIENRPSPTNPRSSALTAHSVCALLLGLSDPIRIGT